jgi:hypothetical protein
MDGFINYFRQLSLMGWLIVILFVGLAALSIYSQLRKRRSTEN